MSRNIQKALQCSYLEPVISKNITNYAKPVISRCNHPILRARNIGGYLATICNSTIIELCDDMIRISHGFR